MHVAQSSVQKGETLLDTALTINAMHPDIFVMRHSMAGAAADVAAVMDCPVINGGDGWGEHPTQALLDALTMRRRKGEIAGLTVAICGDIRHSRVARSNMFSLTALGANVRLAGPPMLLPDEPAVAGIPCFTSIDEAVEDADVVMMLRVQRERMDAAVAGALGNYFQEYGLTRERLAKARPDAIVMHPGPMNRGVEIDGSIADDRSRSAILEQVELGVAVRMACLDVLTRERRESEDGR